MTPEQSALLPLFRERWAAATTATTGADRAAAEAGILLAYRAADLAPVQRIEWCDGPGELIRRWERARHAASVGANVRGAIVDGPKRQSANRQWFAEPDVWREAVSGLRSSATEALWTSVRRAVIGRATSEQQPIALRLRRALLGLANGRNPVQLWPTFDRCGFCPAGIDWLGPCRFLSDVCGLERETEKCRGLWLLAANAGWILPHEHVCWICEPPSVLVHDASGRLHCATGPALAYRGDWSFYVWKGVGIPPELLEAPQLISLKAIEQEPSIVIRCCMIEIMGPERFLAAGGARRVAQDETGILWRKTWFAGGSWAAVEVENATPEPDGTYRRYVLQVPPEFGSARAAVAWTYGMTEQQYAQLTLRT